MCQLFKKQLEPVTSKVRFAHWLGMRSHSVTHTANSPAASCKQRVRYLSSRLAHADCLEKTYVSVCECESVPPV